MKINEVTGNTYEALKPEIVHYADLVIAAYAKSGNKKSGVLDFSNQLGDKFRKIIFDEITSKRDIFDKEALKKMIAQSISDHYFEFKLNDIIPQNY